MKKIKLAKQFLTLEKKIKYNKKYFMTTQKIEKNDLLLRKIQKIIEKNQIIKKWFKKQSKNIIIHEKIIHFEELMYISINLKAEIIKQHHNFRIYEHPGVDKIMKHIRKNYYFPGIKKLIKKHIVACIKYNQNKHFRHKLYKNMRISTISNRA